MRQFKVYRHPSGALDCVKPGWSWRAFCLGGFWGFGKKMWGPGAAEIGGLLVLLLLMDLHTLAFLWVALVGCYGIPAAFDDAELDAAGITVATALEFGADAADSRTFTHAGTPLAAKEPEPGLAVRAEKQKRREPLGRRGV